MKRISLIDTIFISIILSSILGLKYDPVLTPKFLSFLPEQFLRESKELWIRYPEI